MYLRKSVGWMGALLPIVLIAGNMIFFTTVRPESMSGYYYTHMRNVFVGSLCALGVFLIAYAGYDEWDRWITNIGGAGMLGVALFPTTPPVVGPSCPHIIGRTHVVFAASTFVALGVMALRFAKSEPAPAGLGLWDSFRHGLGFGPTGDPNPRNVRRNRICRWSGIGILVCVVLAAASNALPQTFKSQSSILFWLEAVAVLLFGASWFVKGQTLFAYLKDE
jgi:hypothetical protein